MRAVSDPWIDVYSANHVRYRGTPSPSSRGLVARIRGVPGRPSTRGRIYSLGPENVVQCQQFASRPLSLTALIGGHGRHVGQCPPAPPPIIQSLFVPKACQTGLHTARYGDTATCAASQTARLYDVGDDSLCPTCMRFARLARERGYGDFRETFIVLEQAMLDGRPGLSFCRTGGAPRRSPSWTRRTRWATCGIGCCGCGSAARSAPSPGRKAGRCDDGLAGGTSSRSRIRGGGGRAPNRTGRSGAQSTSTRS